MSVNGIGSTSSLSATLEIMSSRLSQTSSVSSSDSINRDSTDLSGPAELFKKLEALSKSDPAKFKQATQEISEKLTEEADSATDPGAKEMLTDLAAKFKKASQTGDASVLKPPQGSPPAGGPSKSGGSSGTASGGSSGDTKTYDPADANKDGTVTLQEQMDYDAQKAAKFGEDSTGLGAYKKVLRAAADQKANTLLSSLNAICDSVVSGQSA
jgi:hypothetical protein